MEKTRWKVAGIVAIFAAFFVFGIINATPVYAETLCLGSSEGYWDLIGSSTNSSALFSTIYLASCGDGSCDTGENSCNCQADCGTCSGSVSNRACKEFYCTSGDICSQRYVSNCCGNLVCETGEDFASCNVDCIPDEVVVEILSPEESEYYIRGEEVRFEATVTADGVIVRRADVNVESFFGSVKLYNNKTHGDENSFDNIYTYLFTVNEDTNAGEYLFNVFANYLGVDDNLTINFVIDPKLEGISGIGDSYTLGQAIEIDGIVTAKTTPVSIPIDMNIIIGGNAIFEDSLESDSEGKFYVSYHTSTMEPLGEWKISLFGVDEKYNLLSVEKIIEMRGAKKTSFLALTIISEFLETYERGGDVDIIIGIRDTDGLTVGGAEVNVITPSGKLLELNELKRGEYSVAYKIEAGMDTGKHTFRVTALHSDENVVYQGSSEFDINVVETVINIEILEPEARHYRVGDVLEAKVRLTYPSGKAVNEADVRVAINGRELRLEAREAGIFAMERVLKEEELGTVKLVYSAEDVYGNRHFSEMQIEVSGTNFLYQLQRNIGLIGVIVVIFIAVYAVFKFRKRRTMLEKRRDELIALEVGLQKKYFGGGDITKEEYAKLKNKYETELEEVKGKIVKEQKNGKKK